MSVEGWDVKELVQAETDGDEEILSKRHHAVT